jgi:hypothetical protein
MGVSPDLTMIEEATAMAFSSEHKKLYSKISMRIMNSNHICPDQHFLGAQHISTDWVMIV